MKLALATQPESYSELVVRSLKLYRQTLGPSFLLAFLVAVIVFIPRLICVAVGQNVFLTTKHWGQQQLLFITIYMSSLWFYGALLWGIHCIQQLGKREHFIAEIKAAGKRMLYVFGAAFILILIGMLTLLIDRPLHYVFLEIMQLNLHRYVFAVLMFTLIAIRASIPLLIFLLFYFYFPLIIVESDGIFLALKQSATLVWGHVCRTLKLILTPWLCYLIVLILIKMVFKINFHVFFMPFELISDLPTAAFNILILAFFIPWTGALMLVQLKDLELRKKAVRKKNDPH